MVRRGGTKAIGRRVGPRGRESGMMGMGGDMMGSGDKGREKEKES